MFCKKDVDKKILAILAFACIATSVYGIISLQTKSSVMGVPLSLKNTDAVVIDDSFDSNQDLLDAVSSLSSVEITEDTDAKYMSVDIMQYVDTYPNVCAYLQVPSTLIDFPIVQYDDNEYYLDKGYAQQDYTAGSPFLDYRNNIEYLDYNNIIYAHNMADGSMFGTLQRLKNESYFSENDGFLYLNSIGYKNIFKIYSVYETDLTSFNYIKTAFYSDDEFNEFLSETQEHNQLSVLNSVSVPQNTKILTLSTCTANGAKRLVVHAYLYNRCVY